MKVILFVPARGGTDDYTKVLAYLQFTEYTSVSVYDLPSLEKEINKNMDNNESVVVVLLAHGTQDAGNIEVMEGERIDHLPGV